MGDGLAAGMMASIPAVEAAAKALADAAETGVSDNLDSHSPSQVMEEQGYYAAQGFIQGVQGMILLLSRSRVPPRHEPKLRGPSAAGGPLSCAAAGRRTTSRRRTAGPIVRRIKG